MSSSHIPPRQSRYRRESPDFLNQFASSLPTYPPNEQFQPAPLLSTGESFSSANAVVAYPTVGGNRVNEFHKELFRSRGAAAVPSLSFDVSPTEVSSFQSQLQNPYNKQQHEASLKFDLTTESVSKSYPETTIEYEAPQSRSRRRSSSHHHKEDYEEEQEEEMFMGELEDEDVWSKKKAKTRAKPVPKVKKTEDKSTAAAKSSRQKTETIQMSPSTPTLMFQALITAAESEMPGPSSAPVGSPFSSILPKTDKLTEEEDEERAARSLNKMRWSMSPELSANLDNIRITSPLLLGSAHSVPSMTRMSSFDLGPPMVQTRRPVSPFLRPVQNMFNRNPLHSPRLSSSPRASLSPRLSSVQLTKARSRPDFKASPTVQEGFL
eukprot:TRINITY_DN6422_c0_g1_i1.p1 TRINITY_DN6422_c0_g1~~TRINITY_DN6422_c0_g1_i1.p1  ORF type:complete len:379 (-),score=53.53 TRINITY_DN6422_c0_g1_i1:63-1199(-)